MRGEIEEEMCKDAITKKQTMAKLTAFLSIYLIHSF